MVLDGVFALFTSDRFTHSLLTYEESVLVDVATKLVRHFLSLVILDRVGEGPWDTGEETCANICSGLNEFQSTMSTFLQRRCLKRNRGWGSP